MYRKFKYILLFLSTGAFFSVQAQTQDSIKREVEVTRAYVPTISDANKLNSMPRIDEEETEKPTFQYSIQSQPVFSTFTVTPLKAATIETSPYIQRGYGLVRAGFGSYYKPYAEVFFNNLNSKNTVFGIHGKHLSSYGNVKLPGGDKVDAPFMNNEVELFVKHTIRSSVLSVNGAIKNDGFRYYGYPVVEVPELLLQDDQQINYFGNKQSFTKGSFHIDLDDIGADIDEREFGFSFDYHYFGTKTEQKEHFVNFTTNFRAPMQVGIGMLDAGIEYTQPSNILVPTDTSLNKHSMTVLFANPAWYTGDETANIKLGINTWFIMDNTLETEAKIAPNIRANWVPVKEIISLYAGIDGEFINNYYSKIAYENPFVNPEHDIKSSMQKIRFFGGFDGKFSRKTAFKFSAEYAITGDQPLYYLNETFYPSAEFNPNPRIVDNTFAVLYDDIERFKLNAEIFHASSDKVDLSFSVNYYNYKTDKQEEAWNLPNWDATFSLGYKISDQLSVSTDMYFMGERKALILQSQGFSPAIPGQTPNAVYNINNLKTVFDLNLKANYQITSKFSAFAQLNNFGFQQYEKWIGYPVQSINALVGISYAF
ncbi:MAG: hypothetical protein ACK5M7_19945 [Draconibacterium sp.]